jgi:WD40 repeat protein
VWRRIGEVSGSCGQQTDQCSSGLQDQGLEKIQEATQTSQACHLFAIPERLPHQLLATQQQLCSGQCTAAAAPSHEETLFKVPQQRAKLLDLRERKAKNNNKSSSRRKDFSTSRHDMGWVLLLLLVIQVWRHKKALWIDHHDTISVLAAGTDVLYSGSWDKTIKVWRLSDFKCLESVTSHIDAVNALAIDEKQGFLYSGSADTTIKVWERSMQAQHSTTTTMQKKPATAATMHHTLIATLEAAQKSPVNALALSPDGSILYSGLSNKTIAVWKKQHGGSGGDGNNDDELRGKQHHHMVPAGLLKGHCLAVLCLSTIADLLISGSADKTIRVWRRSRGKDTLHSCISVMQGHKGPIKSLCTSNCSSSSNSSVSAATTRMGFLVYSGSMDCDVRVWWVPEQDREEESFSDDDDGSFQESPPPAPQLVRWNLVSPT